jgi:hypothetical protein
MSFQWLQMRISEEQDRRRRESEILERLPRALQEVHQNLQICVEAYRKSFGEEAADLQLMRSRIQIVVREEAEGQWQQHSAVNVIIVPEIPGFRIERGGDALLVEVGMLPSDRVFYRDRELDQYLNMDELTKRILDRAFFPKLRE